MCTHQIVNDLMTYMLFHVLYCLSVSTFVYTYIYEVDVALRVISMVHPPPRLAPAG